ncbi:MAG: outer membrane beta-barrel protein, partial [Flavitalea sp.]
MMISISSFAQQGTLSMNLQYSYAKPVGSFNDFLGDASPRGWNAKVVYGISDHTGVGLSVGFQDYYEAHPRKLYTTTDNSTISAVMINSIQTIPVLATFEYRFTGNRIQPYVAVGAGANLITYRQFLGEFPSTQNKVSWAAKPEAGIHIPIGGNGQTAITIGAAYQYMPVKIGSVDHLNNVSVSAGIKFAMRK